MGRGTEQEHSFEDPLTYLPRKPIQEFARRRVIYDPQQPRCGLYLVMLGRVKVTTTATDGFVTVGRIVCAEGLFGESALIGAETRSESALTLDDSSIMSWTRSEIETQIEREPRLGIALAQFLVRQCIELQDRIESMAVHKTPERVMLALLQLAGSVGAPAPDGATRIGSLTHHTISEYVGTLAGDCDVSDEPAAPAGLGEVLAEAHRHLPAPDQRGASRTGHPLRRTAVSGKRAAGGIGSTLDV